MLSSVQCCNSVHDNFGKPRPRADQQRLASYRCNHPLHQRVVLHKQQGFVWQVERGHHTFGPQFIIYALWGQDRLYQMSPDEMWTMNNSVIWMLLLINITSPNNDVFFKLLIQYLLNQGEGMAPLLCVCPISQYPAQSKTSRWTPGWRLTACMHRQQTDCKHPRTPCDGHRRDFLLFPVPTVRITSLHLYSGGKCI